MRHRELNLIRESKCDFITIPNGIRRRVDHYLLSLFDLSFLISLHKHGAEVNLVPALGIFLRVKFSCYGLRWSFLFFFLCLGCFFFFFFFFQIFSFFSPSSLISFSVFCRLLWRLYVRNRILRVQFRVLPSRFLCGVLLTWRFFIGAFVWVFSVFIALNLISISAMTTTVASSSFTTSFTIILVFIDIDIILRRPCSGTFGIIHDGLGEPA